jgi:hypothetical protein
MESKYKDFIGFYNNIFPDYYCQHMIDEFERFRTKGHCGTRQELEGTLKVNKNDESFSLNLKSHMFSPFNGRNSEAIFFEGLQKCYDDYSNTYDILKTANIRCTSVKMQKTDPGGGYHVWHFEQGKDEWASRCLTYIVYLNTLEPDAAGETELLYQRIRVKAEENTAIVFPAAHTHTHRGNVVYGDKPKYIITGWFHFD